MELPTSTVAATAAVDASRLSSPHRAAAVEPLAVCVRGLVKTYADGTCANRGIDLHVHRGEVVAILGPNGAGKTTFLRQITTELKPTAGAIEVFGIDAIAEPERAKALMGITPQEAGLFDSLTVRQHLTLFGRLKGLGVAAARTAAGEVIEELGLESHSDRRVSLLSGGQRRRILIGLALIGRPPLLVLDEPTTGLDPSSRRAVWNVLRRAVQQGVSIVLSTHYMEEAERLSDRIGIINAGWMIADGTVAELVATVTDGYRVSSVDPVNPRGSQRVRRCPTFADVNAYISAARLSEYSIARASLEDVYFDLTGEPFPAADDAGART